MECQRVAHGVVEMQTVTTVHYDVRSRNDRIPIHWIRLVWHRWIYLQHEFEQSLQLLHANAIKVNGESVEVASVLVHRGVADIGDW